MPEHRRARPVSGLVIGAVGCVVVGWVVAACGADDQAAGCEELGAPVAGVDVIVGANGISFGEPAWGSVLTRDYDDFPVSNRDEIVTAVRDDMVGLQAISNAVSQDLELAVLVLYDSVSNPTRDGRVNDQVAAARGTLSQYAVETCGVLP